MLGAFCDQLFSWGRHVLDGDISLGLVDHRLAGTTNIARDSDSELFPTKIVYCLSVIPAVTFPEQIRVQHVVDAAFVAAFPY